MVNSDQVVMLGTLLLAAVAAFLAMHQWPKFGAVAWVCVICFVPVWFGVAVNGLFQAHVLVGLLVVASWLPRVRGIRLTVVDLVLLVVLLLVAVEYVLRLTTLSFAFVMFTQWAGAYLVGRLIIHLIPAHWVYALIAIAFSIVGALAVIEFVTSTNLFITLMPTSNTLFQAWGTLQPRGGIVRAEGAFGHSIALGTSLGIVVGLTLASRIKPWLRVMMMCVMLAGAVVSFSRTGMLTAVLAILLVTMLGRSVLAPRVRVAVVVVVLIGAALAEGFILQVFTDSNETQGSTDYRFDLLALVQSMRPIGLTPTFERSTSSVASVGAFGSIDNAALMFGLAYGWVPLMLAGLCWVAAVVLTVLRRASTPTLTLVALGPAFVTVAFITQYGALVWFLAGLAVATQSSMSDHQTVQSHGGSGAAQSRRATVNP